MKTNEIIAGLRKLCGQGSEYRRTVCRLAADTIEAQQKRIAELEEERRWIPVAERMPEEHDSIFAKFHGTNRWEMGMFKSVSDWVLATVVYQDGKSVVRELRTTDGGWGLGHAYGVKAVTHWRPMPEPVKGGSLMECKYCDDYTGICTNPECPLRADACPVPDTEGICKYEDRAEEVYKLTPKGCAVAALMSAGLIKSSLNPAVDAFF